MTAQPRPMGDDPFATDPARALDAYADATRIAASSALVRRFQAGVAEERAVQRGLVGRLRNLVGSVGRRAPAPGRAPLRTGATFALRLQGLALLLLLVLALGLVAGGAGAAIMTLLDGPTRGSTMPAELLSTRPAPVPTPTPGPTIRVRSLAQHAPARDRATDRRATRRETRRERAAQREARSDRATAVCRVVVHQGLPAGDASVVEAGRSLAGLRTCAF